MVSIREEKKGARGVILLSFERGEKKYVNAILN